MNDDQRNRGTLVGPADELVIPPRLAGRLYPAIRSLVEDTRARTTPLQAGFWVVDAQGREVLGFVSVAPHAHAVLGRHSEVDLRVSDARTTVSLRHALLRAHRTDGDLALTLLDLESPTGIVLHDGRSVRGLSASGPFAAQLGTALFYFLPDEPGQALPDALPPPELVGVEPRAEAHKAPRGHGLVQARRPRGSHRGDAVSVISELPGVRAPREGSFLGSAPPGSSVSVDLPAAEGAGASAFDVSLDGESLGALVLTPAQLHAGVLLGRYPRCWDLGDRPLPNSVSRVHTLLVYDGDELRALDLGSTNGTLVDGERVRSVVVRPNLSISLGDDLSLSALFVG
ncbi:MAG: FHA domain-containing protein [Sandaracinaceae bacterium]|nr:FHA domain-containing protein [Myxococcales bacterium]MCB9660061.1 FHA domain-containing protein [Sandaracinaceae bacterium]